MANDPIRTAREKVVSELFLIEYKALADIHGVHQQRQTQAFNFTILVYGAALAAFPTIAEKLVIPSYAAWRASNYDVGKSAVAIVFIVGLFSIAVPALVYPLSLLFIDVDRYCFGLTRECRRIANRICEPGVSPEEMLNAVAGARSRAAGDGDGSTGAASSHDGTRSSSADGRIDLNDVARSRMVIFRYGPWVGGAVAGCCFLATVLMCTAGSTNLLAKGIALGISTIGGTISLCVGSKISRQIEVAHKVRLAEHGTFAPARGGPGRPRAGSWCARIRRKLSERS